MRTAVPLLLLPLLVAALPAAGFHNGLPIIAEGASQPMEWVSYRVDVVGSTLAVDLQGSDVEHPAHLGVNLYDTDRRILAGAQILTTGTFVAGDGDGPGVPVCFPSGNANFCWWQGARSAFLGVTVEGVTEGTHHVLVWANGAGAWRHAVRADGGAPLASDRERNGFLYGAGAFESDVEVAAQLHVEVHSPAPQLMAGTVAHAGAQAHMYDDASITVDVEDTLIGWMTADTSDGIPIAPKLFEAWVDGPDGRKTCHCSFPAFEAGAAGPGRYAFHVDGASGDAFVLSGVDARLPR